MPMKLRLPRHLASAGLLAAGLAAGMALAPTMSIHAQDRRPVPTGLLGTDADVPTEGGLVLRAPLRIIGGDGQMLFEVTDQGMIFHQREAGIKGGLSINYGSTPAIQAFAGQGGKGWLVATDNGNIGAEFGIADSGIGTVVLSERGGMEVASLGGKFRSLRIMQDGRERVVVGDDKGSMGVHLKTQAGIATVGTSGERFGLFLKDSGGTQTADLSQRQGGGMALRMYAGGKSVAQIGSVPGRGGAVRIFDQDEETVASIDAMGDGGLIHVYKAGSPAAALVGGESVVAVYNSGGVAVASLQLSPHGNGGNVTTRDGSGAGVFSAGAASDGLGEACVSRISGDGKATGACLGVGLPGMGVGR